MNDHTRRVALVTGGANGIGWATAQRFAQEGCSVAVADLAAQPAEIARAICFLASDAASYITGTVLSVDGGWYAYGAADG